jgi:hemolysin activation/secretion protein
MRGYALWLVAMTMGLCGARAAAQPAPAPAPAPAAPAPSSTDSPKFEIREFKVEGNTLLKQAVLDRAFAPFIGRGRDFGDVQKALEALEKAYTTAGYGAIQVSLPEQELNQGVITLKVTESKIAKIVFEGNRLFDEANIRNSLPSLREGAVPNVKKLGIDLRLANESPSKQTAVILRNTETDGEVDAVVRVAEQQPTKYSVSLDNTGTKQTGDYRLGLGLQSANLFNRDQVLTAQILGSPTKFDKVLIAGFGYHIPLYQTGDSIDVSGGYSNVSSGVVQGLFNVAGKGTIGGLRYNFQLPRLGEMEQKVSLGYDYRAFDNNITPIGGGSELVPSITVHPVSLTYSGLMRFASAETSFYLSGYENLPGGHNGGSAAFEASRAGSRPGYVLFRYGGNINKAFANDWQMRLSLNGQQTRDALISGEQFGLGGVDNVRGFLEREISNDRGYRTNAELYTPDFGPKIGSNYRVRLVGFYDQGRAIRNHPASGEDHHESIGSVGLGLRMARGTNLTFRLDYGYVIDASGSVPGTEQKGHSKLHGSLVYVF